MFAFLLVFGQNFVYFALSQSLGTIYLALDRLECEEKIKKHLETIESICVYFEKHHLPNNRNTTLSGQLQNHKNRFGHKNTQNTSWKNRTGQ